MALWLESVRSSLNVQLGQFDLNPELGNRRMPHFPDEFCDQIERVLAWASEQEESQGLQATMNDLMIAVYHVPPQMTSHLCLGSRWSSFVSSDGQVSDADVIIVGTLDSVVYLDWTNGIERLKKIVSFQ